MTPPAHQRVFVTVHAAAELIEGRRADVVRMLREAGLVRELPIIGERVCVPALVAWWDRLKREAAEGPAAEVSPATPEPPIAPATTRTDIRVGGLGLVKGRKAGVG